ncbi:MAG TPA: hypothetical protein VMV74_01970 [Bacteroidales bacterium]|nr:hypothetical protein [Bacteroidales bacterium]
MELFGTIRLNIGRAILRRQASSVKRLKPKFDFDRVKNIGVLWDATKEDDLQHVAALIRKMAELGKTVEVLAWIPGKIVPDRMTGLTYMKFLRQTDLNWFFIPKSEDFRLFAKTRFDLLIGINPSRVFPLAYIATVSPSLMKAGPDDSKEPENEPYDLMIQAGSPFKTALFLEQLLHYLTMISSPETRA